MNFLYALEKYDSAYDFFLELSSFFKNEGYEDVSCSRRKLYDIFYEFWKIKEKDVGLFSDLLLFDYYKNNKCAPPPVWASVFGDKEFLKKTSEYISKNRELIHFSLKDEKLSDILKVIRIYPFSFGILSDMKKRNTAVLFDYENNIQIEANMEDL